MTVVTIGGLILIQSCLAPIHLVALCIEGLIGQSDVQYAEYITVILDNPVLIVGDSLEHRHNAIGIILALDFPKAARSVRPIACRSSTSIISVVPGSTARQAH